MSGYFSSLLRHTGHPITSQTNMSIVPKHGIKNLDNVNSPDKSEPASSKPFFHVNTTDEEKLSTQELIRSFPDRDGDPVTWKKDSISELENPHSNYLQIMKTEKDSQRTAIEPNSPKSSYTSVPCRSEESINLESINLESINLESINLESINLEPINLEPVDLKEQMFKTTKSGQVPTQINGTQQTQEKTSSEEWYYSEVPKNFDVGAQDIPKSALSQASESDNSVPHDQWNLEKTSDNQNSSQELLNAIQLVADPTFSDVLSAENIFSNHISLVPPLDAPPVPPGSQDLLSIISKSVKREKSVKKESDSVSSIQEILKEKSPEIPGRKMPAQEKTNSFFTQNEVSLLPLKSYERTEVGRRNLKESLSLSIGSINITIEEPKEAVPPRIIQVFENPAQDETGLRISRHYVRIR